MEKNDTLSFKIKTLSHLIKRTADNSSVREYYEGMTGVHSWIIGYLIDNQNTDIYQRDIERHFNIRRSTATGILQLMEKNGMIERRADEKDGRMKKLILTDKARQTALIIKNEIAAIEKKMLRGISFEEAELCRETLKKMELNLKGEAYDKKNY